MTRNILLIVNPNAGQINKVFKWFNAIIGWNKINKSNTIQDQINSVINFFEDHGCKIDYAITKKKGDATRFAKKASSEAVDTIIAMGGDGTINEVVNGMIHSKSKLGVIPYGTANVFGLSFNLPTRLKNACNVILNGQSKSIDLGSINGHYFVCMAGVGFDAYIIKKADKALKKTIGALSYVVLAMLEYYRYKFHPIVIKVDDDPTPKKGYFMIICNTKYYGGKFVISDKTDPADGLLDICLIKDQGFFTAIKCSVQLALGKIKKGPMVEKFQCKKVHIRAFGRHRMHCDAEYIGHTPAKVIIHPNALRIIH